MERERRPDGCLKESYVYSAQTHTTMETHTWTRSDTINHTDARLTPSGVDKAGRTYVFLRRFRTQIEAFMHTRICPEAHAQRLISISSAERHAAAVQSDETWKMKDGDATRARRLGLAATRRSWTSHDRFGLVSFGLRCDTATAFELPSVMRSGVRIAARCTDTSQNKPSPMKRDEQRIWLPISSASHPAKADRLTSRPRDHDVCVWGARDVILMRTGPVSVFLLFFLLLLWYSPKDPPISSLPRETPPAQHPPPPGQLEPIYSRLEIYKYTVEIHTFQEHRARIHPRDPGDWFL